MLNSNIGNFLLILLIMLMWYTIVKIDLHSGHLKGAPSTSVQSVVHFTEIICCNTKITNVLIVFEDRIVSLQPKEITGCDTLLKRNIGSILLSNTEITFVISVLQQMISVKCTTAMHTGWRCPFKSFKYGCILYPLYNKRGPFFRKSNEKIELRKDRNGVVVMSLKSQISFVSLLFQ